MPHLNPFKRISQALNLRLRYVYLTSNGNSRLLLLLLLPASVAWQTWQQAGKNCQCAKKNSCLFFFSLFFLCLGNENVFASFVLACEARSHLAPMHFQGGLPAPHSLYVCVRECVCVCGTDTCASSWPSSRRTHAFRISWPTISVLLLPSLL